MSAAPGTISETTRPRAYARTYGGMEDARADAGDARILRRIIGLVLADRARVAVAVGATVAASLFQLAVPPLLGDAVDGALGLLSSEAVTREAATAALSGAALLLLAAAILRGAFTLVHNYVGEAIGHHLAYRLRLAFYDKLQHLQFSFHDRVHTGELITRGMLDLDGVRMFVNTGLVRVVQLAILIGAGAWLLVTTDVVLGLVSLSFVPFVAWYSAVARLRLRFLWLSLQDRMAVLGRIMDENLTGIRVVRAFGAEPHELARYDRASDEAMALASARIRTRVASTTTMTFAYYISMGLVLWLGGMRVLDGTMTVGTLAEFLTFITILQLPVRQLGLVVNAFARATTCGARLFAVLDLEPRIKDQAGARPLGLGAGTVRFEAVWFAYDDGAPVLRGISFEVGRGRTLGIVGPPGSGKSTIAQLLPRFYDPTRGRITIDGVDIRDVTLATLREAVVVVQQDSFLFTTSIENNIAYGDPCAGEATIGEAASLAQIEGFVDALPEGYRTLVGERGVSLSGGQRQRIAIARAALLAPAVLVFDDSMAAIDAATERRIRESLKAHTSDATTIIVSHRLGALAHADEILFLDDGRIVERGSHEALVAAAGRYAALHALQRRGEAGS